MINVTSTEGSGGGGLISFGIVLFFKFLFEKNVQYIDGGSEIHFLRFMRYYTSSQILCLVTRTPTVISCAIRFIELKIILHIMYMVNYNLCSQLAVLQ